MLYSEEFRADMSTPRRNPSRQIIHSVRHQPAWRHFPGSFKHWEDLSQKITVPTIPAIPSCSVCFTQMPVGLRNTQNFK